MTSIIKTYESRIKKGIAILDRKLGRKNWAKKIDLAELDLSSPNVCMLGEIYGDYSDGKDKLKIKSGETYGFEIGNGSHEDYGTLTRLWIGALYKLGIKG
jgi:hypothetical protein